MLNRRVTPLSKREKERIEYLIEILKKHQNGVNVPTKKLETDYYAKYHPNNSYYYTRERRSDLTKMLQKGAEHDMLDGDWVGNGYLWSLKPRDRGLITA